MQFKCTYSNEQNRAVFQLHLPQAYELNHARKILLNLHMFKFPASRASVYTSARFPLCKTLKIKTPNL
jgi:hypothetical protein